MKKRNRTVNKKLIDAAIAYVGSSYLDLSRRVDPPVTRPRISQIMNGGHENERIMRQITELLQPVFDKLADEIMYIDLLNTQLQDYFFPRVYHESVGLHKQGEDLSRFPVTEEKNNDQTGSPEVYGGEE